MGSGIRLSANNEVHLRDCCCSYLDWLWSPAMLRRGGHRREHSCWWKLPGERKPQVHPGGVGLRDWSWPRGDVLQTCHWGEFEVWAWDYHSPNIPYAECNGDIWYQNNDMGAGYCVPNKGFNGCGYGDCVGTITCHGC